MGLLHNSPSELQLRSAQKPAEIKHCTEDENQGMFFYWLREGGGIAIDCSWEKQMAVY